MPLQLENYDPALRAGAAVQFQTNESITTGTTIQILASGVTTGKVIEVDNAGTLSTGFIADFASNSASGSTRSLIRIVNDSGSATGTSPLEIQQDATLSAIRLSGAPTKGIDLSALSGTGFNLVATLTSESPGGGTIGYIKILAGGTGGTVKYIALYS